jgi:hypothetical protein
MTTRSKPNLKPIPDSPTPDEAKDAILRIPTRPWLPIGAYPDDLVARHAIERLRRAPEKWHELQGEDIRCCRERYGLALDAEVRGGRTLVQWSGRFLPEPIDTRALSERQRTRERELLQQLGQLRS